MVAQTGGPLGVWIGEFLAEPQLEDVRAKLARSGAVERHAFIFVPGLTTAPFPVMDLLMRNDAPPPTEDPLLPSEITHVWIMSTWSSGAAFFWSRSEGWRAFDKTPALATDAR